VKVRPRTSSVGGKIPTTAKEAGMGHPENAMRVMTEKTVRDWHWKTLLQPVFLKS
jgi:hypothetical protein